MANLLYIEASPRKARSISNAVAQSFIEHYLAKNPSHQVELLNVWDAEIPEFDGAAFRAKYAALEGRERTPGEAALWDTLTALAWPLRTADKIVIASPMWNWGIPYKLKHFIDAVSQKDVLFTFDERGLCGILTGRKAALVLARGLDMSADSPYARWDMQEPYLRAWLESIGIANIASLRLEGTLRSEGARDAIEQEISKLAQTF